MARIVRIRKNNTIREITIPKTWCEEMGWKWGDNVALVKRDDKVIMKKIDVDKLLAEEEYPIK